MGTTEMPDRNVDTTSDVPRSMEPDTSSTDPVAHSTPDEPGAADSPRRRFGGVVAERVRVRIRKNKLLNTTWRFTVFTVGVLVVLAGLVMLVTPGPGWLGIILGFMILATEFVWARRALRHAQRAAKAAKDKALDPKRRRRNQIVTVVAGVAVLAVCAGYLGMFGLTLPWHADIADKLPWVASVFPGTGTPAVATIIDAG